ncbi:collagenase-like isoform X2 [Neocloeon triangulifer]|uniref:collagenase-like isoform X2 n=1 Tax=Neocloeon triangulifer TaxID=2078957 RepID=UPI00286F73AB|nr:collagenase-like isoform X2 [Neocloeon triangulifer]
MARKVEGKNGVELRRSRKHKNGATSTTKRVLTEKFQPPLTQANMSSSEEEIERVASEQEPLDFISLGAAANKVHIAPDVLEQMMENLKPTIDQVPDNSGIPQPAIAGLVSPVRAYIVGGEETLIKNFPWQAGIIVDRRNFCGGSLITAIHILTAAHCADNYHSFSVYLGGTLLPPAKESGRTIISTSEKIIHADWSPIDMQNDIALLVLPNPLTKEQMNTPNISPIRLPAINMAEMTFENQLSNISGWGLNATGGALTKVLNFINITVVPLSRCVEAYGDFLQSSIICCEAPAGKATCQGDSGGPLVIREADKKYTQIGIVSFGPLTCGTGPLGFTRVTSYLGWISKMAGIALRKTQVESQSLLKSALGGSNQTLISLKIK